MSETSLNPLLTTENLDGVIAAFPKVASSYALAQYMPLVNRNADKIRMDIDKALHGGVTPGVSPGAESPIIGMSGRAQREWDSAHFREKVVVSELELIDRRVLGTRDQLETAMGLLNRKFQIPMTRLANRLELMRRETFFSNQVTIQMADGTTQVVSFPKSDAYSVTAGVLWTDTANAEPLADLQLWVEDYVRYSGFDIREIVAPLGFYRLLTACDEFAARAVANTPSFTGSPAMVKQLVADFVGIPAIREEGARINFNAEFAAAAIATATTITLKNTDQIVAGDVLVLKRMSDFSGERVTVLSVSGNTVTLTAGLTLAYAIGDIAGWMKMTIPDGKLLFVGQANGPWENLGANGLPDADRMDLPVALASTYSRHIDLEPRPGMFVKMVDKRANEDVARVEMIVGISAMVEVNYSESWFVATYK